MLKLD
jgi:hypothetical protein